MYKLNELIGNTYFINSMTNVGIFKINDRDVILIDSGNSPVAGKHILNILNANNWNVKYILNTHSHADHIGANKVLQQSFLCKIYISKKELLFARHPIIGTSLIYGGRPCDTLLNDLMCAEKSNVEPIINAPLPVGLIPLALKGHSIDMYGFKTPDGVVFLGDAVVGKRIIDANSVIFNYDIEGFLKTLEKVEKLDGKIFVPSHGKPVENIGDLVEYNRAAAYKTVDDIVKICAHAKSFDDVLKELADINKIKLNFEKYTFISASLRSYISYLLSKNLLKFEFVDNKMMLMKN